MPFQFQPEAGFLRLRFFGHVTRQEFAAAARELQAMDANGRVPHRLTDLRDLDFSELKGDDVLAFAKLRRETRFANRFRSAILAPNPAQFGYARMFQIVNDHPDITIEVFTDEAPAIAWLMEKTST